MTTHRLARLTGEIREEVARIVARLKDPRIGFVTITRVSLTADLRHAKVHVGILGGPAQRERSLAGLRQATGFVRRELGKTLRLRFTPELAFEYDSGLDAADRVAQLLEEVKGEESAGEPEDE